MITTLILAAALVVPGEAELKAKLPEVLAKCAAHYKALDAAATPLRKGEISKRAGRHNGDLYTPHGFNAKAGKLDMRSIYWWTAGHYPGSLWYLYEATGDAFFRDRATEWTEILAPNAEVDDNHDVGFIMYCSFGNARRLLKTDKYDQLLVQTADSLSRRFNKELGVIRSWGSKDEKKNFLVIPDNMMNLELLEFAAKAKGGDARFDAIARSHADKTMANHFRSDGGCYHVLDYDQRPGFVGMVQNIQRGQGLSCGTAWSRGQAWGIYGYTMMYRETRESRYLAFAKKLADFAIGHPNMPADGVPYWDFGAPGEERDSSAAACMASALLELETLDPESRGKYRAFAVKQLLTLCTDEYLSEGDEIGHFILKHGVGHKPGGSEIDVPLDYGDYYFLEALVRFRALVTSVRYEDFGAKGDGVHDDRQAIVAAHAAANARGVPVRATDGVTYYVGAGTNTALVATDVDFGTAQFIVDDREVSIEDRTSPLFRVVSLKPSVAVDFGAIRAGQRNLGVKLPAKCFVFLRCDSVRQYIRKGLNQDDGHPQQEPLIVDENGDVDPLTPVHWDYPEVTSSLVRPIDETRLTIRGGHFLTRANQAESAYNYFFRGFSIERSNVLIEQVSHRITDEMDHGAPYKAFILVEKCADVTVRDCVFQAHKVYTTIGSAKLPVRMGSYDLTANWAINVSYVNCRQTTDILDDAYWGLFGSNYCKHLLFDGCVFSRFDAHCGVAGATVRNSTIGYMGLSSIGSGTFTIENTTIRAYGFVRLRPDYGSTWDGKFVIRNCRYEPAKPGQWIGPVVVGENDGTHDFGYVCHLPDIEVDGLFVDDSANPGGAVLYGDIGEGISPAAKHPVVPPAHVTLRNVTTASGQPMKTFANPEAFKSTRETRM